MVEEMFVITVLRATGGSRGLYTVKDAALSYAEQVAEDPEVEEVEVRAYNTLDLINAALDELDAAMHEDPWVFNGEVIYQYGN